MPDTSFREAIRVGVVACAFVLIPSLALAQATFGSGSGVTCPGGNVICNGSTNWLSTELFFEPEVAVDSLKKGPPTWNEIEQLLDNPYATTTSCTDTGGPIPRNDQGFPTYCTNIVRRAPGLPRMLVHPLNHNPTTGTEMRLINPLYLGGSFNNTGVCYSNDATTPCTPPPSNIQVSSGGSRLGPEDAAIDYNVKYSRDPNFCEANPEPVPLRLPMDPASSMQDVLTCGADPGEPGYAGFGVLNFFSLFTGYSTPAVPTSLFDPSDPSTPVTGFFLFDPNRGFIFPRDAQGDGGLRKPSLRVPEVGGSNAAPNYLYNSTANLAARGADTLAPSNENDYLLGGQTGGTAKENARLMAMRLGKSLFWDQQVGSDAVQACGSCHAHAGADSRHKNQVNPNDLGGDLTFTFPPNYDLQRSDFPFHRLADPEIAGDPICTTPIVANVAGITFPDGDPPDHPLANPNPVVCAASNIVSDTNDVASSMGVHFGIFKDIPSIGSFTPPSLVGGVRSVLPDLRETATDCLTLPVGPAQAQCLADISDPIPGFAGTTGTGELGVRNQFRRVEPRNTPTIFLADVNFDNFWDGRARHDFNGGSVFGPADPQSHVFVNNGGTIVPTRQLIKFSSLASLATGPALSKFEMSFDGRNWAKIGKKLLQAGVTPLANQLVSPTDSLLGPYSNQNGASTACTSLAVANRSGSWSGTNVPGKPGLCISYQGLIRLAFRAPLHNNTTQHLNGCYTDGRTEIHPNQCSGTAVIPILTAAGTLDNSNRADPFDNYVLTPAPGAASVNNTNQFTQMEANFSLFFGLSLHLWATILVPDNTPWDRFLDQNPDAFEATGETGEPFLVNDLPNCGTGGTGPPHRHCFVEVGNFKRDSNLTGTDLRTGNGACIASTFSATVGMRVCTQRIPAPGTRVPGSNTPDPLLGMDIFFGSNLSLKNPNFRSARCGECHAPPTLTDHTTPFTHKWVLGDISPEFDIAGHPLAEPLLEPLGRPRIISGFLLESETNAPGQDAVERRTINQSIAPAPVSTNPNCSTGSCSGYAFPDGIVNQGGVATIRSDITNGPFGTGPAVPFTSFGGAFFDNGMYNIGVRPCVANQSQVTGACEDNGRGNTDAFGWPLSLAALMMKNLGGVGQQPGVPLPTFNPSVDPSCAPFCGQGGLFTENGHDQQINPGFGDEEANPLLPPYLAPFANKITVGDAHPQLDEGGGPPGGMVNTLTDVANAEGFPEIPFDPNGHLSEVTNPAVAPGDGTIGGPGTALQGTWPMVNRVGRFGSFKAPQLREVELTGPYFHNGGKLTLRQVVDFYTRGGDFPVTNSAHRDFNIINLNAELQSNLSEEEKVALVDFLLELTDDRVAFERSPFDHPQMILPLDGLAPDNSAGRDAMLAGCIALPAGNDLAPGGRSCAGGMFLDVPAVGASGNPAGRMANFLGISSGPRLRGADANCGPAANNQYCH